MAARVTPELTVVVRVAEPDDAEMPLFECLERRRRPGPDRGPHVLVLRGELSAFTAQALGPHLDRCSDAPALVLDMHGVTFIDSTALDICADIARRRAMRGQSLHLVGVSESARFVIAILRLGHLLEDAGTVAPQGLDGATAAVPDRGASAEAAAPPGARASTALTIRNLDGGYVIEVIATGAVGADRTPDVAARIDRLIRAREPGELRIDLTDAEGDADLAPALIHASDTLWSIGSRLVLTHPSPELRSLLPADAGHMLIDPVEPHGRREVVGRRSASR